MEILLKFWNRITKLIIGWDLNKIFWGRGRLENFLKINNLGEGAIIQYSRVGGLVNSCPFLDTFFSNV